LEGGLRLRRDDASQEPARADALGGLARELELRLHRLVVAQRAQRLGARQRRVDDERLGAFQLARQVERVLERVGRGERVAVDETELAEREMGLGLAAPIALAKRELERLPEQARRIPLAIAPGGDAREEEQHPRSLAADRARELEGFPQDAVGAGRVAGRLHRLSELPAERDDRPIERGLPGLVELAPRELEPTAEREHRGAP